MKYIRSLAIACCVIMYLSSCVNNTPNPKPITVPAIQEWYPNNGYYKIGNSTEIEIPDAYSTIGQLFADELEIISGVTVKINTNSKLAENIVLSIEEPDTTLGKEGYKIEVSDQIRINANEPVGLFYATRTLLQIIKQDTLGLGVPKGTIIDYSVLGERALMMDLGRKYFSMDYIKKIIRNLSWLKINTLHLHFSDWSGFRLKSDKFPDLASKKSYSKKEIRELQDYAKKYHIMIIPEIDLPAHATEILRKYPEFGFECESMLTARWLPDSVNETNDGWILNMTKPEVRTFIKELLDEFVPLFDSPYFHIGGDEWQYDNQKEACDELMNYAKEKGYQYPGDVYVEWINEINAQIKSYGKTTQIWNWWGFSPSEEFQNKTSIEPDKDIVINVWNRVRKDQILKDGYHVILTPETGEGALYVTPGEWGTKPGDYGYFDTKFNYEQWEPQIDSQILGYKVCLWSDKVESKEDEWFDPYIEIPLAVLAQKTWGSRADSTIQEFESRLTTIGKPVEIAK